MWKAIKSSLLLIGKKKGMTALQLVMILLLVSALSVFVGVNIFSAVTTFRLNSAAAKLISDISYAQHLARSHNTWYGIRIQADPINHYSVYSTDGVTDTNVIDPVNPSQPLVMDVAGNFNVSVSAVNIGGGDKVEFNPMGVPYDDMSGAPLAASGTVTLSRGGSQKIVEIMKNTGRVGAQ